MTPSASLPDHIARLQQRWLGKNSRTQAQGSYVLRQYVLEECASRLRHARISALLVKGAALALSVYPSPWERDMGDIDLIVRPQERDAALRALGEPGWQVERDPDRTRSAKAFGETVIHAKCGAATMLVEVHTQLDKLVARPVDLEGIFARALPAPGLRGLSIPSLEDHVLLIALHAAGHEFRHPIAFVDLELMLSRPLDWSTLVDRARQWQLQTVLYLALQTLRALGSTRAPEHVIAALEPRRLRRWALARVYDVGIYPPARGELALGIPWVLKQTPLRDDLVTWSAGVAKYTALRLIERIAAFRRDR